MKSTLFSSRLCRDYPDRPALVGGGASCSYAQLQQGVWGLSRKLRDMGVEKGSRVALWGYNCVNWLIAFFAIVHAGGAAVLLNYSLSGEEAAALLRTADAGFLLCGDNAETKKNPDAMQALASLAGIGAEHCLDIRPAALDLSRAFPDAVELPDGRSDEEAGETALLLFTSGTTSRPKAVQISQRALSFDADAFHAGIGEAAGGAFSSYGTRKPRSFLVEIDTTSPVRGELLQQADNDLPFLAAESETPRILGSAETNYHYLNPDLYRGSLFLVMSETAGFFHINFNQTFETDRYYRAFLRQLDAQQIPYETLPRDSCLTPEIELPPEQR